MCLSLPYKIIKLNKNNATVKLGRQRENIGLFLVKNIKLNDYVLVQNELAIRKISQKQAKEILSLIQHHKNHKNF